MPSPTIDIDADRARVRPAVRRAAAVLALVAVVVLSAAAPNASAAPVVTTDLTTLEDGVAPFDGDNAAGHDSGGANGIVRSFDGWRIRARWAVHGEPSSDVRLTLVAGAGSGWRAIPTGCLRKSPDLSTISADSRTIDCRLGAQPGGASGWVDVVAAPTVSVQGASVQATSMLTTASGGLASSTPVSVTVSSAPQIDVNVDDQFLTTSVEHLGTDGFAVYWPVTIDLPGDGRGVDGLTGPVSFRVHVSDVSGVSPGSLLAPDSLTDLVVDPCGPIGFATGVSTPYGFDSGVSANPANTTRDSGTWTCVDNGDGTTTVTVTGVDWGSAHFPVRSSGFGAFGTRKVLVAGYIGMFVPRSDLEAICVCTSGSPSVTVEIDSQLAVGVSGGAAVDVNAANDSRSNAINIAPPGDWSASFQNTYSEMELDLIGTPEIFPEVRPRVMEPTAGQSIPSQSEMDNAGDGLVTAGQDFDITLYSGYSYDKAEASPLHNRVGCAKFDPNVLRLSPRTNMVRRILDSDPESPTFGSTLITETVDVPERRFIVGKWNQTAAEVMGRNGIPFGQRLAAVEGVDYVVEFGVGSMASDADFGTRNCDDADADVVAWTTDPTSVPGGDSAINMVRVRIVGDLPAYQGVYTRLFMEAQPGVVGSWVSFWGAHGEDAASGAYDGTSDSWTRGDSLLVPPYYEPSTHLFAQKAYGDRAKLTDASLWITMSSDPPQPNPFTSNGFVTTPIGSAINWQVTGGTRAAPGSPGSVAGTSVSAIVPAELEYDGMVSGPDPSSQVPDAGGPGTLGLTWNLGAIAHNGQIPTIEFRTIVRESAPEGGSFMALATISGALAEPQADGLTALGFGALGTRFRQVAVAKRGDEQVAIGGSYQLQMAYDNTGAQTMPDLQMLNVLPYVGDFRGPASDFHGTSTLVSVAAPNGETVEYTSAPPSQIVRDPAASLPVGHGWCTSAQFGSAGCPASIGATTAIRVTRSTSIAPAEPEQIVSLTLQTSGNAEGDVYADDFHLRSTDMLATTSNVASVRVPTSAPSPAETNPAIRIRTQVARNASSSTYIEADNSDDRRGSYLWGERPVFRIIVTNIGDVALERVTVSDPLVPACDRTFSSIAAGATIRYTCRPTNAVTAGFSNLARVSAYAPGSSSPVTHSNVARVTVDGISTTGGPYVGVSGTTRPRITTTASVRGGSNRLSPGQSAPVRIVVRNAAPTTAYNVRVCVRLQGPVSYVAAPGAQFTRGAACWTVRALRSGRSLVRNVRVRAAYDVQGTAQFEVLATSRASGATVPTGSRLTAGVRLGVVAGTAGTAGGGVTG